MNPLLKRNQVKEHAILWNHTLPSMTRNTTRHAYHTPGSPVVAVGTCDDLDGPGRLLRLEVIVF